MCYNRLFKMPNGLILNDKNLQPSTISVAAVFYAYMNRHRRFTGSLDKIAARSHRCVDTVRQAVEQLEEAGYIARTKNYAYLEELGKNGYAQTTYQICGPVSADYTLIPYRWLGLDLTPCAFQTLLVCRMFMIEEKDRSYPSLCMLTEAVGVAKSTICAAIKRLHELGVLIVEHCKKENGAYTCNSYHMIKRACEKAVQLFDRKIQPTVPATANDRSTKYSATPFLFKNSLAYST